MLQEQIPSIVAIDDDPFFLGCLSRMKVHGEQVHMKTFEDPRAGISWLADHKDQVNLVICDLDMPELNGMGVLRELSSLGYQGLVVPASGFDSVLMDSLMYYGRLLKLKMLKPLTKPVSSQALQDRLEATCVYNASPLDELQLTRDELERAFLENEFHFAYQPLVDQESGLTRGVEMLVRWKHPAHGVLSPGQFLSHLQDHNLMGEMNKLALENAVDTKAWLLELDPSVKVFVNITLSPDGMGDLVRHGECYAAERNVSPAGIVMEVTENSLVLQDKKFLESMVQARLCGFQLALDDFGTGYTSFEWLDALPFTHIKIDRDLVMNATTSDKHLARFRAVAEVSRDSGLVCVAEGVETEQAAKLARALGCQLLQGWHLGRPVDIEQIPIAERRAD